ncbi:hypothetical protein NLI96_g4358 [Meripilus lineatus]|uniref:Uncharacterized protein n=1 Tax=Meripilus lineatus TaxID=2056292 RepID=A0AAD5V517_9APHY|nr:hypothetical protein NLI96_g4358 [Physisporinus lineatus]
MSSPSFDLDNRISLGFLGKLGEGFLQRHGCLPLISLTLGLRPKRSSVVAGYLCGWVEFSVSPSFVDYTTFNSTTGLFKLPSELIYMILELLDHFPDALALVMANKMLYNLGFTHIQQRLIESRTPCVGSRLICLGDNSDDGDLPDAITKEELEEIPIWQKDHPYYSREDPCNYYTYATETFPNVSTDSYYSYADPWVMVTYEWREYGKDYVDDKGPWYNALTDILKLETLNAEELVLCNLTKREYADGAEAARRVKDEDLACDVTYMLAAILKCRICWSSDDSIAMADNPYDVHRGVWAGDHFKVTTKGRLLASIEKTQWEWNDVTEEVVKEVEAYWDL